MPPEPLSDIPFSPASQAVPVLQKRGKRLIAVGVSLALVALILLAVLLAPMIAHRQKRSDQSEMVTNMRQIALALLEFEARYGKFPGVETVATVRAETLTDLDLGTRSSNDFLRQLLASGIVRSEAIFHADIDGTRRPDEVMSKGEALKEGECGFVYLANLDGTGNPGRPLLLVGLIPGTDRFDKKIFQGKTILAKADGSVMSLSINRAGHVILGGKNILDPANPVWGGKPPVIAWPEL